MCSVEKASLPFLSIYFHDMYQLFDETVHNLSGFVTLIIIKTENPFLC